MSKKVTARKQLQQSPRSSPISTHAPNMSNTTSTFLSPSPTVRNMIRSGDLDSTRIMHNELRNRDEDGTYSSPSGSPEFGRKSPQVQFQNPLLVGPSRTRSPTPVRKEVHYDEEINEVKNFESFNHFMAIFAIRFPLAKITKDVDRYKKVSAEILESCFNDLKGGYEDTVSQTAYNWFYMLEGAVLQSKISEKDKLEKLTKDLENLIATHSETAVAHAERNAALMKENLALQSSTQNFYQSLKAISTNLLGEWDNQIERITHQANRLSDSLARFTPNTVYKSGPPQRKPRSPSPQVSEWVEYLIMKRIIKVHPTNPGEVKADRKYAVTTPMFALCVWGFKNYYSSMPSPDTENVEVKILSHLTFNLMNDEKIFRDFFEYLTFLGCKFSEEDIHAEVKRTHELTQEVVEALD